jgi:hypothetical protein
MKNVKKLTLTIMSTLLLTIALGSCTNKEEKMYGKILTKDKSEKELITRVQNAYFAINNNVTLKEAIAANPLAKNVVWSIRPLEELGTYLVSFQYDIEPIDEAMRMDFFDSEEIAAKVFFRDVYIPFDSFSTAQEAQFFRDYTEGDVLSPVGYANIFTRFIRGEAETPHNYAYDIEEMQSLLDAYTEYREEYEGVSVFIPLEYLPDPLPEPFFVPTAGKFIGDCYIELRSEEVAFVQFSLLFDFRLPYMDDKEYKGVGMTINESTGSSPYYRFQDIEVESGLEFVYRNIPIGMIYPYAGRAVTKVME